MTCKTCNGEHELIDIGDEGRPEWICRSCILESIDPGGESDLDLTLDLLSEKG